MSEKAAGKDVIYIDVDDEITSIIDKVRGSHNKIVALVLPKRATVLQSIVNMKLLKRSADEAKKNLVLITAEAGLMPLAGNVGLYVAKTLQSKPEIPEGPEAGDGRPEDIEEDDIEDEPVIADTPAAAAAAAAAAARQKDTVVDRNRPVGELAGAAAMDDTIELDDDDEDEARATDSPAGGAAEPGKPKDKKLAIPNFNKFRLLLALAGAAVIVLAAVVYVCAAVLPKATVSIKTDSQAIDSSTVVTLKTNSTDPVNVADATVPAKAQQTQKTLTEQTPATGQQNNGDKATGSVVMSAGSCSGDLPDPIPAGTGVSANGVTFITDDTTTFGPVISGTKCSFKSGPAAITAQSPGEKYNIPASSFTVAGHSSVTATSSAATSGGTDNITKIVTQADIDTATQKITSQDSSAVKTELKTDLKNMGYLPVDVTFSTGTPQTKTSANAGDAADNVSVTQVITYTMLGVKQDDLKKIIADDVKGNINTSKQKITDYGLSSVIFGLQSQPAEGAVVTMQATAVAGPELNADDIKKQVAGKKAGAAKDLIKQNPGVTDTTIKYSPFWVSAIPKNTSKITVTIEKPTKTVQSGSSSNASNNP